MTRLWLVRLGKNGEFETAAFEDNILTIGFSIREDITELKDRDALIRKMAELYPEDKPNRHRNFGAQVNQFVNVWNIDDLVISASTISVTDVEVTLMQDHWRIGRPSHLGPPVQDDRCTFVKIHWHRQSDTDGRERSVSVPSQNHFLVCQVLDDIL